MICQRQTSRPDWDTAPSVYFTKSPDPNWKFGNGANSTHAQASPTAATAKHIAIDPEAFGRSFVDNYKLCISAVVPRPIAFISTRARDASSENLAPMSFFQLVNAEPPIFVVGITSSIAEAKDTLRNLVETRECVLNIVSEGIIEALNSTSIDAPYGVSEWDVSGLTPVYDCETVSCARVKECIFSIEAKVESIREFDSRRMPGVKSGSLVTLEATRFWAREDALNEEKNQLNLQVLRPMSRLGGITYGRVMQIMELPRPFFEQDLQGMEGISKLKKKRAGKE
ncbi:hypothetical protein DL95DRAFT_496154 [Leptodontidium sp. 2 PMI_412]|nr:hypothetical protein DL95DRAFT_496154 [Leptodontidium sp. 2 PMI_412]